MSYPGDIKTLPDGRQWNGLAYIHDNPVAGCNACDACIAAQATGGPCVEEPEILRDESGQDVVEYTLIMAFIAIVLISATGGGHFTQSNDWIWAIGAFVAVAAFYAALRRLG